MGPAIGGQSAHTLSNIPPLTAPAKAAV